jgi:hypothetical protein
MFWGDENIREIKTAGFKGRFFAADQCRHDFRNQPTPRFPVLTRSSRKPGIRLA